MNSPSPTQRGSARHKALLAMAIGLVLLVGAGVVVAVGFEPWLRARVKSEALQRGITLDFEDFNAEWGKLTLHRVAFQQERPIVTTGRAEHVVVVLEALRPKSITLEQPTVDVIASPNELLQRFGAPAPPTTQSALPVNATALTLNWRTMATATPVMTVSNALLALDTDVIDLRGPFALAQLPIGTTEITWDLKQRALRFEHRLAALGAFRLTGDVQAAVDPITINLRIPETPLPGLWSPLLGVALMRGAATQPISVGAHMDIRWPIGLTTQTPNGKAYLTLKNFEPPHPVELSGYDFGKQTDVATDFSLSRDNKKVLLKNIRIQAGSFALGGEGSIDASRAQAELRGSLSCALLAKAAAEAHLGSVIGKWAGQLATRHVEGKVAFEVDAELNFKSFALPRLEKRVFPGCGLKPLELEDLPKVAAFELKEVEKHLREVFPDLPNFPDAPSLLPVPSLPVPSGPPRFPGLQFQDDAPPAPKSGAAEPPDEPPAQP